MGLGEAVRVAGIGCRRGVTADEVLAAVAATVPLGAPLGVGGPRGSLHLDGLRVSAHAVPTNPTTTRHAVTSWMANERGSGGSWCGWGVISRWTSTASRSST